MYFAKRKDEPYYAAVKAILESFGKMDSILDVGSWDTPVASWGSFSHRYTIDPNDRPDIPGVTKIIGKWPDDKDKIPLPVSVVVCLQLLEHLDDPREFAKTLFDAASRKVVVSVPYRWPVGSCKWHKHEMIDERKLADMVGRVFDTAAVVGKHGTERVVAVYDVGPVP